MGKTKKARQISQTSRVTRASATKSQKEILGANANDKPI